MNIFLTGGTGFVGSNFLEIILTEDYSVKALKRLGSKTAFTLSKEPIWIEGSLDINKPGLFHNTDVFVHLASHSTNPPYDNLDNCLYWNVLAPIKLASQAASEGVENFLIAGSCSEYGVSAEDGELSVSSPLEPNLSYSTSKAASSIAFKGLCRDLGLKLRLLRFFHVFGEGEPENRFWPSLKKAALAGNDFSMSEGDQIRDFIHVRDVSKALVKALDFSDIKKGIPHVAHVASGNPQTLLDFAKSQWRELNGCGELNTGQIPKRRNESDSMFSNPKDIFREKIIKKYENKL